MTETADEIIVHDADGLRVGYHNARRCTVDGQDCFVGWVRQNGRLVDASGPEDGDSEPAVQAWCRRQVLIRGFQVRPGDPRNRYE